MAKRNKKGRRKTKNLRRIVLLEQESGELSGGGPRNPLVGNAPEQVADAARLPDEKYPVVSTTIHSLAPTTATTTVKHGVMAISSRKRKATEFRSKEHLIGSLTVVPVPEQNHQGCNSKKSRSEKSKSGDCPSKEGKPNSRHYSAYFARFEAERIDLSSQSSSVNKCAKAMKTAYTKCCVASTEGGCDALILIASNCGVLNSFLYSTSIRLHCSSFLSTFVIFTQMLKDRLQCVSMK